MRSELIVKKSVLINSDVSKVWDAITDPAQTKKYMYNSEVISDWVEGGTVIWRDADTKKVHVKGIILKIEPALYLETKDLSIDAGLDDVESNYSRVLYKLTERKGKTLLEITEDSFNGDERRYNDAEKFWGTVLKSMKELLEE